MGGYIRKRDKDVWQLVVDLPKVPISGERRQKCVTVHGSKRNTYLELQKLLSEAQQSRARDSSVLVESAIREWIALVAQNLSPTTIRGYMGLIDFKIVPALGKLPLANVTPAHLDRLYRDLTLQGSAPASVRQIQAIIRRFFNQAMKWGWVASNSALLATPPKVVTARVVAPTVEQLIKLVKEAKAKNPKRWIKGNIRNWDPVGSTSLVPSNPESKATLMASP